MMNAAQLFDSALWALRPVPRAEDEARPKQRGTIPLHSVAAAAHKARSNAVLQAGLLTRCQMLHHDRTHAKTADYLMERGDRGSSGLSRLKQKGAGAYWKQWLPQQTLRQCFTNLHMSSRHAATQTSSSHTHVRKARCSLAQFYLERQNAFIAEQFGKRSFSRCHDWVIYQLLFDETQMRVCVGDNGAAQTEAVFAQHGRLQWQEDSGTVKCQECVLPPQVLDDKSADSMFSAINKVHLWDFHRCCHLVYSRAFSFQPTRLQATSGS